MSRWRLAAAVAPAVLASAIAVWLWRDNRALRGIVATHPALLHPLCRAGSAGFSRQEVFPPAVAARYRRTFWFDEKAWRDSR